MSVVIVTGSAGLVGSETTTFFGDLGFHVVGIDNDMRSQLFGTDATVKPNLARIKQTVPGYEHYDADIRDQETVGNIFKHYGRDIALVVHTAAQPSHDFAATNPHLDYTINANGTLNMLECTRQFAPDAPFIFMSTNKVYGDRPNTLPLIEKDTRWEIDLTHEFSNGISEGMSIDNCLHSLFGASKVAADVLVQEYGRYFGLKTACFRAGCVSGPHHSGAQLHGFLSYLMKCTLTGTPYTILGYKGKQVRDNIHSADLVRAFYAFYQAPRSGEIYNIGGGRLSNCSLLEAIALAQDITGRDLDWHYHDQNRIGDHIWWISDFSRFTNHYPEWSIQYDIPRILSEIAASSPEHWHVAKA